MGVLYQYGFLCNVRVIIIIILLLLILYNTVNVLRVNQQPVLAARKS